MYRSLYRIAGVLVLLSLVFVVVPAAQAAPLAPPSGAYRLDTSWLHAVFSWLTGVLAPGGHEGIQGVTAADTSVAPAPHLMTPMSGNCVDPSGGGGVRCNS
jgi:hypothetical protein